MTLLGKVFQISIFFTEKELTEQLALWNSHLYNWEIGLTNLSHVEAIKGLITWQISARAAILLQLHDGLQPGLKLLALATNMKLRAKSLGRIKVALRTWIVKIGALLLLQFGLLAALNFQLFGMVTAYKMMELKRNLSLAAYLSARKTYLQRKRRYFQACWVHGFLGSVVLFYLICRAGNPSPVCENRARVFSPGWIPLHVINNLILRGFVSEAGLKLQPGLKFAM